MKSISFIGLFILAFISNTLSAQTRTDSVKVSGNCSMCKHRIETSTIIHGVTQATWDVNSKLLTVSYNSTKANMTTIMEQVAASGHDTEQVKATDLAYNKLPGCCRYERSKNANTETKSAVKQPN